MIQTRDPHPEIQSISRFLALPVATYFIAATLFIAVDSTVLAADTCVSGNCPTPNAATTLCPAPAKEVVPRQAVDTAASPTWSSGIADFDGEHTIHLTGGVELRQAERVLRSGEMTYDVESGSVKVPGEVELSDPNLSVRGTGATASTTEGTVDFTGTSFTLPARDGRGSADHIRLSKDGEIEFQNVRYTTCPGPNPAWELAVSKLSIDAEAREGTARNAWVNIKGIPVFYTPYISFPVGNERKSGFLAPNIGNSTSGGGQISTPWYWNIAPNYDATITPTWYSKHGFDLGTEFGFLTESTRGAARVNYLPDDQNTGVNHGRDRRYFEVHSQTDFLSRLRMSVAGSRVSDREWLEDFGSDAQRTGVVVLPRSAQLVYRGDEWAVSTLAQNYQIIDPATEAAPPYTLLPQVSFRGWFPDRPYGLTFDLGAEYTNFLSDNPTDTYPDAQRLDSTAGIRLPLRTGGLFLEPAAAWRSTVYQFDRPVAVTGSGGDQYTNTSSNYSRNAPMFSVDTGLVLERPSGQAQQRTQTLEPRLLYLYVPYRPQDGLPSFDTKQPDLNLIQLFSTNRYVGADRLGDANQIAVGATSRLLDSASGQQFMSATVGEVYRFTTPKIALPGEPAPTSGASDLIGELQLTAYKDWNAGVGLQWNPNSRTLQRAELNMQYLPAPGHVINAGYVFRKDGLSQQNGIKQAYASAAWTIGPRVSLYGRYVYSLKDTQLIDGMAGFEYRDCCWGMRLGLRRSVRSVTGNDQSPVQTKTEAQYQDSIQWQIELNGLAPVGSANDAFLAQAIRGYSAARFDRRSVP